MATTPETKLWLAVIQQALWDLVTPPGEAIEPAEHRRVRHWFFHPRSRPDFTEVCERAGVEPRRVERIAREMRRAFRATTSPKQRARVIKAACVATELAAA